MATTPLAKKSLNMNLMPTVKKVTSQFLKKKRILALSSYTCIYIHI